jgi:nucleotide-binding universal stress UspA family protein
MSDIRTILAAASGGAATAATLELACRLADRFAAHLEVLHVRPDARTVFAGTIDIASPASTELLEGIMREAAARAAQSRALFDEIARRHKFAECLQPPPRLPGPSASWRAADGDAAHLVARHARFFDLVVLGRSDRVVHEPHSDTIEETLTRSGRPVLLAPTPAPETFGARIAIAWDGSPPAVRALAAALPFLATADEVLLLTAGAGGDDGTLAAVDYLAWHGITARYRHIDRAPSGKVGRVLLDAATEMGADLLVMGGYGQAPWRELLFGGATRTALATTPLPLLLMH